MFIYGNDGHAMHARHPLRVDRRDLDTDGNPKPGTCPFPVGKKLAESPAGEEPGWVEFAIPGVEHTPGAGEKAFDHQLSAAELETHFPGYAERVKRRDASNALKLAVAMGAHDDELAQHVIAGTLTKGDFQTDELSKINERLKLRGKAPIA